MDGSKAVFIASLCLVMTLSRGAPGETVMVQISATAIELSGTQPDYFGVWFNADHDVRIKQIIYDLTFAQKALYYDTAGPGSYDFALDPSSSPVGATALTADNSPHLVINFTDFQPGEVLYFGIDVDGLDCSTWTAFDFSGTYLGVLIDPAPAFPWLKPQGIATQFKDVEGKALAFTGTDIPVVPEPASCALVTAGGLLLLARRIREAKCRPRAVPGRSFHSQDGADKPKKKKEGLHMRSYLGILLVVLGSLAGFTAAAGAADLLVVDDSHLRAFFGFYGSSQFADQPEKLWDDTVRWAVGGATPSETHVLLFTFDGTLSDNNPANTDAIGFNNLLVAAGYQVEVDSRLDFATRTSYADFELAVFPNFAYSDAGAPPADNVIASAIPFITMEPGQTDELMIGTGVTVFSGTLTQALVVDNNHVITDAYGLGDVILMVNIGPPAHDVPTDGITRSGRGRVLIGEVPEPGTAILLTLGALIGAAGLRRRRK